MMRIRTLASGFDLTPAIDEAVRNHFGTALRSHADDIRTVDIFLAAGSGPLGAREMVVTASIHIAGQPPLAAECAQSNLYAAIAGCSRQSKRRVRRIIEQARRSGRPRGLLHRRGNALTDVGCT